MFRIALAVLLMAGAAQAQVSKEEYCGHTSDVVAAIQKARLDRVPESKVADSILAAEPGWPTQYNGAISQLAPWVYQQKMRDLRKQDMSAIWNAQCVANWDSFKDQLK